jgi:hypothetical protein
MNLLDSSFRPKDGIEAEDAGDEVLIYLPGGDKTLYLNETAAIVWRLCDGVRTGHEVMELLTEAYPDDAQEVRSQVLAAIEDFIARGIIDSDV